MENSWQTFGHANIKNILNRQIASGGFAHAYLFLGPEGVGKKTLALEFARKILNAEKLHTHPDFQILQSQGEIVMEQVLDFIGKIGYKPFLGAKKIAVIDNAENLNTQSANALLKTLEEPSASTIIILIAGSRAIPQTILSRCQVLNFDSFGHKALKDFAGEQTSAEVLELAFGKISRLKQLMEDKSYLASEKEKILSYQKLKKFSLGQRLATLADYAEMEVLELKQNFFSWMAWQKLSLAENPERFTSLNAILEAIWGLDKNLNKKLVLQNLFMKI